MPRLFVGNFDFEQRLACGGGTLPRHLERLNAELSPVWTAIAEPDDVVWTPMPVNPVVFERLAAAGLPSVVTVADPLTLPSRYEVVFWGENEWAVAAARRWYLRRDGCSAAVARRVNSRRFKFGLERRLGVDLPGATCVTTAQELTVGIGRLDRVSGWVLKGEFGGAGREVRFGSGAASDADFAWAANRFRRGLAVFCEPRLDRVEECGLQFRIGRDGEVTFDGVTPLLTRPAGGYLGNRFDDDPSLEETWSEAIDIGRRVADAVAAEGYFGPLGIDAMRHRATDGSTRLRPLQDLNARHTMGRLALGLRRFPGFARTCGNTFRPDHFRVESVDKTVATSSG